MKKIVYTALVATFIILSGFIYPAGIKIAKLKYNGGGDWYANKTSLPNLIAFCKRNIDVNIQSEEDIVEVGSADLFNYPFVHLTGHDHRLPIERKAEA